MAWRSSRPAAATCSRSSSWLGPSSSASWSTTPPGSSRSPTSCRAHCCWWSSWIGAARDAVAPLVELAQRRRAREAVEQLDARLGRGGPAIAGLAGVLEALTVRRVEALLYAEGYAAPGSVCPQCGWLGTPAERCPVD